MAAMDVQPLSEVGVASRVWTSSTCSTVHYRLAGLPVVIA